MNELNFCGIDVAKQSFVVGISSRKQTKTFTNNPKGIQQAVESLKQCANLSLIVLESTGGLEIPLAKALCRADFGIVDKSVGFFAFSMQADNIEFLFSGRFNGF